jgi:hypothetical protein
LRFVLQLQKPDGSIGYLLQESRILGAKNNIFSIRINLKDTYVQALDAWLDANIEMVA